MTFSLCLQIPNHIHFKRYIDIYANFIPQIIFLESIFGYLVVCIIYKWTVDWSKSATVPPSLLNMLIAMFLSPGTVKQEEQLYAGQSFVQVILVLLAIVCIPWMLCTKPYFQWKGMQKVHDQGYVGLGQDGGPLESADAVLLGEEEGDGRAIAEDMDDEQEHEDFGEIVIHQIIHTIEFCLGCISHTASYLRLWALSLAHAQLSEVLWDMTLGRVLGMGGVTGMIMIALIGIFWFSSTIFILCLMEGLSAFLHAVRLHWVEAMSKHYEGTGYAFTPLTFASLGEKE